MDSLTQTQGSVLCNVAIILKVPDNKMKIFQQCLLVAVRDARRGHGKDRGLPRKSPVVKVLKSILVAKPEKRLKIMQKETAPSEGARAALAIAVVPAQLEEWLPAASIKELSKATEAAIKWVEQRLREGGRTPGTTKNPAFDVFVKLLYHFAANSGAKPGNASRHGEGPAKGPIPSALNILKNELPAGFIPASEESILNAVRRAKAEWDEK